MQSALTGSAARQNVSSLMVFSLCICQLVSFLVNFLLNSGQFLLALGELLVFGFQLLNYRSNLVFSGNLSKLGLNGSLLAMESFNRVGVAPRSLRHFSDTAIQPALKSPSLSGRKIMQALRDFWRR